MMHELFHFESKNCIDHQHFNAGCSGLIGSVSAWHASSPEFDPHVRHILSWRLGHEKISMAILHLLLIQEEPLAVTGERISLSTAKMPGRLAQEQLVKVTDRARNDLKCVGKEIKPKKHNILIRNRKCKLG